MNSSLKGDVDTIAASDQHRPFFGTMLQMIGGIDRLLPQRLFDLIDNMIE
ncbi:hypothetical protein ACCD06_10300 [Azospirillum sp. CT11-132]